MQSRYDVLPFLSAFVKWVLPSHAHFHCPTPRRRPFTTACYYAQNFQSFHSLSATSGPASRFTPRPAPPLLTSFLSPDPHNQRFLSFSSAVYLLSTILLLQRLHSLSTSDSASSCHQFRAHAYTLRRILPASLKSRDRARRSASRPLLSSSFLRSSLSAYVPQVHFGFIFIESEFASASLYSLITPNISPPRAQFAAASQQRIPLHFAHLFSRQGLYGRSCLAGSPLSPNPPTTTAACLSRSTSTS
jgi:hypothetical protein